ncbi:Ovate protein family, C-terminal [Dillenia turbinata]|uniref:Transcription repressor n=1 Tax=Dillenia turbinata TaxID=194707 RepID=A0AAN8ZFV8_9MAGN
MSKRFKLKLPTFQFCRTKSPSSLPQSPIPAIHRLSPINPKAFDISYPALRNPPPSPKTQIHSPLCHSLSNIVSIGCGCKSKSCRHYIASEFCMDSPDFGRNSNLRIQSQVIPRSPFSTDSDDIDSMPVWHVEEQRKSREKNTNKKWNKTSLFSSIGSDNGGWIGSKGGGDGDNDYGQEDNDDETETLISSSRSFPYEDSSYDFSQYSPETINENAVKVKKRSNPKKIRKFKRFVSKKWKGVITNKLKTRVTKKIATPTSEEFLSQSSSPLMVSVSMFQRIVPSCVEGKVLDSFAVVKKSKDPYQDFKKSMLEMILEKQIFRVKDLEQLLQCFLSLNSQHHHKIIVEAFTEIWEVLFGKSPV